MGEQFGMDERWVVVGDCGLYIGQYLTRADAITDHVTAKYELPPDNKQEISRRWRKCRASGDRVVKAEIFWDTPP